MSKKFFTTQAGTRTVGALFAVLLLNVSAHAQYQQTAVQYAPVDPFFSYHSSTFQEGYLRGEAAYAQGYGQMQLSLAQAAVQQENARRTSIENDALATQNRIEYKEWLAKNRKRESIERYVENVKYLANRPALVGLDNTQIDTNGYVAWPKLLLSKKYTEDRELVDNYFHEQAMGIYESQSLGTVVAARKRIADAFESQVDQIPQADFIPVMRFLTRLNVQIHRPTSTPHTQMSNVKADTTKRNMVNDQQSMVN